MQDALLDAFLQGDPVLAYKAALALIHEHDLALMEIARHRFALNFGSSFCTNCEGLRAGPDVVATCFQMKQCHFTNLKKGEEDPKHLRILEGLLDRSPR